MSSDTSTKIVASFLMCTNVFNYKFKDAVNSCLNQTIMDIELVLVINGVNKYDKEKISNFCQDERIVLIFSNARYLTYNLNLGLQYCNSNYVARMDSDDISHPQRIEKQIDYMYKNPSVAVCGSAYRLINNSNAIIGKVCLPVFDKQIRKKFYYSNPISHPSVMFKKDIILKVGGYMGGKYAQDYDLWLRVSRETDYQFHNLIDFLIDYRSSGAEARSSREAYSCVSSAQWHLFVLTLNPLWLFGSILNFIKILLR